MKVHWAYPNVRHIPVMGKALEAHHLMIGDYRVLVQRGHQEPRGPQDHRALQGCQVKGCPAPMENQALLVPKGIPG
ncbi:unnamed protein product [Coregonus sp. 'balchen']|nr:unnamed protein product [Coregonus sp. 'balchen']